MPELDQQRTMRGTKPLANSSSNVKIPTSNPSSAPYARSRQRSGALERSHHNMRLFIGSAILIVISLLVWAAVPNSSAILKISDFSSPVEATVSAPIPPFGNGALYVMYEGKLDTDAIIEVKSNNGRDTHTIKLAAGRMHGVYGGAEMWVDDLLIRFVPSADSSGDLRIALYCGAPFSTEDRAWHQELSQH